MVVVEALGRDEDLVAIESGGLDRLPDLVRRLLGRADVLASRSSSQAERRSR